MELNPDSIQKPSRRTEFIPFLPDNHIPRSIGAKRNEFRSSDQGLCLVIRSLRLRRVDGTRRGAGSDGRHQRAGSSWCEYLAAGLGAGLGRGFIHQPARHWGDSGRTPGRLDSQGNPYRDLHTRIWGGANGIASSGLAPQPAPVSPTVQPFAGTLEIVTQDDDGPPNGVTLDQAIDITLKRSLDLLSKSYEISMARADTLQANLRSNPVFYQDGQLLQYRGTSTQFSRAAPGGPQQFDTNITYPLDISHKRQARTVVATRAEKVLEALFQDAVRQRIDDIYGAFVAALAARQTVRYANASVKGLENLLEKNRLKFKQGDISEPEVDQIRIRFGTSRLALVDAEAAYRKAKLDLGALMNLKLEEIKTLELKGTISDVSPPPPPADELRKIAVADRPDILSFRLGIVRAEADVRLARANAFSDVYVLWQPYTFQDNTPYGLKSQYLVGFRRDRTHADL